MELEISVFLFQFGPNLNFLQNVQLSMYILLDVLLIAEKNGNILPCFLVEAPHIVRQTERTAGSSVLFLAIVLLTVSGLTSQSHITTALAMGNRHTGCLF